MSPALPLAASWIEIVREAGKVDLIRMIVLVIVSASLFWIVLSLFYPLALGPYHSRTRSAIIGWNIIAMAPAVGLIFLRKSENVATALSAVLTGLAWGYISIINSIQ